MISKPSEAIVCIFCNLYRLSLIDNLIQLKRAKSRDNDMICAEDKSYVGKVVLKHRQLVLNFNKQFDRLD